jgi:elongation factor G
VSIERNRRFYRETVLGRGIGDVKIARVRDSIGVYAHVRVAIRPLSRGQGTIFEWNAGLNIPAKFANAVSQGVQDAIAAGKLGGFELTDVCVAVQDGSYHQEDSTAEAFREAAEKAVREATLQAGPIILEALSSVTITVPEEFVAAIEAIVKSSGGQPSTRPEIQSGAITASVPSSDLRDFVGELLRISGGQARISIGSAGFRPRPEPPDEVEQWVVRA